MRAIVCAAPNPAAGDSLAWLHCTSLGRRDGVLATDARRLPEVGLVQVDIKAKFDVGVDVRMHV